MLMSVSSVHAMTMNAPSRSAGPAYARRSQRIEPSCGERAQLGPGLGRDERHVAVAGEQALDLLQPDLAAADHEAARGPRSFRQAM